MLYPTIISVDFPQSDHYSPILLLTKLPLPSLSSFYVFHSGQKGTVTLQKAQPLDVDEQQRNILLGYTMRISRSIQNKAMTFTSEELPYFFAPLSHAPRQRPDDWWNFPDISDSIPWDAAKLAADHYVVPLTPEHSSIDDQAADAVIQERWVEFTNRQFVKAVRHDLTPLSRPEKGTREAGFPSFSAYCEAHRKEFTGLKEDQPLIEVSLVPNIINNLDPFGKAVESSKPSAKYLIPEFCAKFTIPASTFRTALLLPSILHRVDGALLIKELNSNLFDDALNEDLLYTAISCPSANLDTDYNRLEFLGDAFLKYVVSAHCFVAMPEKREGGLHSVRQQIISNRALHNGVVNTGLPAYIQGKPLIVKIWQPVTQSANQKESSEMMKTQNDTEAGEEKRGKRKRQQDDQSIQWLGDKTVADVVEALIGAAYLSNGIDLALRTTQKLKVPISGMEEWSRSSNTSSVPHGRTVDLSPSVVAEVERVVSHPLKPAILAQALTHTSMQASQLVPYDRLEFLGDAVLDFQEIVRLRDEEERLSQIESRLPREFWSEVDAPKVLSDIIESIMGALLVSNEFSLTAVEGFFDTALKPFFERYIRLQTLSRHPNVTLYEFFQAAGCQQHRIQKDVDHDTIQCSVLVHDVVLATITGTSSSGTVRMVSTAALTALDNDPSFMERVCDCRSGANQNQPRNKDMKVQLGYEAD
ncbi:hypothetical protein NLI96_g1540 [Meripilus lineatus]|uniref:RNase III domain-containing protein n=1 Tax=Meripilus lineatus TaxID=2056292 RepID=A0AAD5VAP3_9APHY|nr:hypothetical protein NLI96_g1540 [Physisporinus lineatus]